jgi:hypothetical protein
MHPVLTSVSFVLGRDVSAARLFVNGDFSDTPLADMTIAHDLMSIPAVQRFSIKIEGDVFDVLTMFEVEVENPEGVTVLDVFTNLAEA